MYLPGMVSCFQNGVRNENRTKTWVFRPELRFFSTFRNRKIWEISIFTENMDVLKVRGIFFSRKWRFFFFGVFRPYFRPWIQKKYLEPKIRPIRGRKIDFEFFFWQWAYVNGYKDWSITLNGFFQIQERGPTSSKNKKKVPVYES